MLPSDDAYDSDEPPSLVDPNVNYDNYALEEVERSPLIIDELQHVSIIVRPRSEDSSTWSWERRNIAGISNNYIHKNEILFKRRIRR